MKIRRSPKEWEAIIEEQNKSGETVATWCKGKGIHPNFFYKKKKELCTGFVSIKHMVYQKSKIIRIHIFDVTIELEGGTTEHELLPVLNTVRKACNDRIPD